MGFQPRYYTLPNGSTVYFSDTIPSAEGSGVIANVGDMCIVSSATASGAELAWMCIKAGSPGTWVVCARGVQEYIFGPLAAASTGQSIVLPGGTWQVAGVTATATAAGGAAGTVDVEYLTGTTAAGSGTAQLTAALAIGNTYTPNTVLTGTVISPPTAMAGGTGRLGIFFAGSIVALANLYVKVSLQKIS